MGQARHVSESTMVADRSRARGLAVYAAIAMLVSGRSWVIAAVAALLGGMRAFCGALTCWTVSAPP
jgi:hypothetical protein